MNTVDSLLETSFSRRSLEEKLRIKQLGRPTPPLCLQQKGKSHGTEYTRKFALDVYDDYDWLCGCNIRNSVFCFPCLLFGGELSWAKTGVSDLKHLKEKLKRHDASKGHKNNVLNLSVLGKVNIRCEINSAYALSIVRHNEEVRKNRAILSTVIDALLFCGNFELPLRGHNESRDSINPGVFRGLLEYTAKKDPELRLHLEKSTVFRGTSADIQNELLDTMFEIYQEDVKQEISKADFLGVMADETTDISNLYQMVIIFRYEIKGQPVERFWKFVNPSEHNAEALSNCVIDELNTVLGEKKQKLVSQSYDGANVMSGRHSGVQIRVRAEFPNAHFIHCYAHKANLVIERSASASKPVKVFFSNLSGIPTFFSESAVRTSVLDLIVKCRLPHSAPTRWNFKSRTVSTVSGHREDLIKCFEKLESDSNSTTSAKASAFLRMMLDSEFVFWLTFFNTIMPHVDILFNSLQNRGLTSLMANASIKTFVASIASVRNKTEEIASTVKKLPDVCDLPRGYLPRRGDTDYRSILAKEVCDTLAVQTDERFQFTGHLSAANLLLASSFENYTTNFPEAALAEAATAYPMLDKSKLKTELEVLYSRGDCQKLTGCVDILNFILGNKVERSFTETSKLVRIVLTTPMTTVEAERCFSTLKRVKTAAGSTMKEDRLDALTALTVEKAFIENIDQFHERVITRFAETKPRSIDLIYKASAST